MHAFSNYWGLTVMIGVHGHLGKAGAGVGRCVFELVYQKQPAECSLMPHPSPALLHMSVSHFSCDHPRFHFLLLCRSVLYPGFCSLTLSVSLSLCLASISPGPATSPQHFLRCRFSVSAPAAICLIISVFLSKIPRGMVRRIFRKLNIEFPFDPTIPLPGCRTKKIWKQSLDFCVLVFIAALFTAERKCARVHQWINGSIRYIYNAIFSLKGKEITAHAPMWVNFYKILLSEKSQTQKDKYWIIPLMWGTWSGHTCRNWK